MSGRRKARKNRDLVIVRAGPGSLHPLLIQPEGAGEEREYDLLVCAWHEDVKVDPAPGISRVCVPGQKVAGYAQLFLERPEILKNYENFALLDDDLLATPADVNALFRMGRKWDLDLWQPSLTPESHFTYAALLQCPSFELRFTNFVEMMCPFFSKRMLQRAQPLFRLGFETGMDLVWSRLFPNNIGRSAIIDAVSFTHTRPVGTSVRHRSNGQLKDYDWEVGAFLEMHGAKFGGNVCYAAITPEGRHVTRRSETARRYLGWLGQHGKSPMPAAVFYRRVTDAIRHELLRPVNLSVFDLATCVGAPDGMMEQAIQSA